MGAIVPLIKKYIGLKMRFIHGIFDWKLGFTGNIPLINPHFQTVGGVQGDAKIEKLNFWLKWNRRIARISKTYCLIDLVSSMDVIYNVLEEYLR